MSNTRTVAPEVLVVDEHLARNPLARAVARARMTSAARDFATRLYLLDDGEDAAADTVAAARTIQLAYIVAVQAGATDSADARVMAGAISAMTALARRQFAWRRADAPAIDAGLQRAVATIRVSSAQAMQDAWRELLRQERIADQAVADAATAAAGATP